MDEPFIASNGYEVYEGNLANISGSSEAGDSWAGWTALVEYGRHLERTERDENLGRWRSKSHPNYVVYPRSEHVIVVIDEKIGESTTFVHKVANGSSAKHEVAREYFDSIHPLEPWVRAEPGEVWLLTVGGPERPFVKSLETFLGENEDLSDEDLHRVTAGRRIWPEA